MRPTISLSEWRIAIDLDATRKIRRQTGHPAENCTCADCKIWRSLAPNAFPPPLSKELLRLGVQKDKPTDLYLFGRSEQLLDFRVIFHVVGKILSGPAPWVDSAGEDRIHHYHVVQSEPAWIGLRVCTVRDSFEYAPTLTDATQNHVLCVDFRLQVHAGLPDSLA